MTPSENENLPINGAASLPMETMEEVTANLETQEKAPAVRPNAKRAANAILLLSITMGLDVISIISSYFQLNLLNEMQAGVYIPEETLTANDIREQLVAILYSAVNIATIVVFILWFRRAYFNLSIRTRTEHSEGWAAGSWFVPFIAWFRPYQIMSEMWQKTTRMINEKSAKNLTISNPLIGIWWGLWIIISFVARYVIHTAFNDDYSIDNLINGTVADMISAALDIPLAIIIMMIIREYSVRERLLEKLERTGTSSNKGN